MYGLIRMTFEWLITDYWKEDNAKGTMAMRPPLSNMLYLGAYGIIISSAPGGMFHEQAIVNHWVKF